MGMSMFLVAVGGLLIVKRVKTAIRGESSVRSNPRNIEQALNNAASLCSLRGHD